QRFVDSQRRAIGSCRFTESKETARIMIPECGQQVIKSQPNKATSLDQIDDRADALAENLIGATKGIVHACGRQHNFAHAIILETNDCIRISLNGAKRFRSLLSPPPPLERKGQRYASQHECTAFARKLCHQWRRT